MKRWLAGQLHQTELAQSFYLFKKDSMECTSIGRSTNKQKLIFRHLPNKKALGLLFFV